MRSGAILSMNEEKSMKNFEHKALRDRIMTELDEDYLFPPEVFEIVLYTITTSLYTFVGPMGSQYNLICAGVIISFLPALLVFIFCQDQIYSGITGGAVKG